MTHSPKPPCTSDAELGPFVLVIVSSPKSVALPVDAIVTKSIVLTKVGVSPQAHAHLIELFTDAWCSLAAVKLQKSV